MMQLIILSKEPTLISLRERSMRSVLLATCLLLLKVPFLQAQVQDKLPPAPDYIGEIRRGVDGKLVAKPESEQEKMHRIGEPATMRVGPAEKVTTLTEAARLAKDGEIIDVLPGNYRGQSAIWTQHRLLIRGVGERPVMIGDGKSAEGKAIWVVRGGDVTIENVEFRGARVANFNGAGIRFEKGNLVIQGCRFIDNEMGILTANSEDLRLEVRDSEFADAPRDARAWHHLIYVGKIARFVLRGSYFHGGYLGHLVKSRARESHILYNMLVDGDGGKASYELEFPNGGLAFVIGNVIGQSAGTDNPIVVSYGAESPNWRENSLYMVHNTLLNDRFGGSFLTVHAENFPGGVNVWQINNLTVGSGTFYPPSQGRFEGNRSALRSDLIEFGGVPVRLTNQSPLRGAVRPPGSINGVELLPTEEFHFPVGTRSLRLGSSLSPGAFQ